MAVFQSDGLTLDYIDVPPVGADRREPILLIHGFASNRTVNWIDPSWVRTLTEAGRRVIALDNRGHGASDKPHDEAAYHPECLALDAARLLAHLAIERADVMGYSMGARITAFLASSHPDLVRSAVLGGLGIHLVEGDGLPQTVGAALEAPTLADVQDPMGRLFRRFAEANRSDLKALSACIRGTRRNLALEDLRRIVCPVLIAVGTRDPIAGDPRRLAALLPQAQVLDIPDRDHNLAVGDKQFKAGVLAFLASRP